MKLIRILGEDFKLKISDENLMPNWSGSCDYETQEITLLKSHFAKFRTVIHEIVHGYMRVSGSPIPNDEEELCCFIGAFIESLVRQNGLSIFAKLHKYQQDNKS